MPDWPYPLTEPDDLGFSMQRSLRNRIEAFQRHYDHWPITGELDDVEDDLILYHDRARVPVAPAEPEPPAAVFPPSSDEAPAALPQYRNLPLLKLCQRAAHDPSPGSGGTPGSQWLAVCQYQSQASDNQILKPEEIPPPTTPVTHPRRLTPQGTSNPMRVEQTFTLPASPTAKTALEDGCP